MPSPTDTKPSGASSPPRSRQKPGNACEECRRRKLRCDRQQPRCGLCVESNEECRFTTARPRGPKRGHMKALQARLAAVEEQLLSKQAEAAVTTPTEELIDFNATTGFPDWAYGDFDDVLTSGLCSPQMGEMAGELDNAYFSLSAHDRNDSAIHFHQQQQQRHGSTSAPIAIMSTSAGSNASDIPAGMMSMEATLPDLVHADRDQLFFDRVHPFIPVLNEHRYHGWTFHHAKTDAQICLQQVMWTLGTSSSAQPATKAEQLYRIARKSLEELEVASGPQQLMDIKQTQAWLLIAIYEFMRVNFNRGWMSAGRAFRRVQLQRLHEVDLSDRSPPMDWVEREERRRTFWLAYSLDRFISLTNGSPLTFHEQVHVRMPAPHMNFQSGQPVIMDFLSGAMLTQDTGIRDSFTEFIIMATICGRALQHRQMSVSGREYSRSIPGFWERHQQIHASLAPQLVGLSISHATMMNKADPILLFTHTMAQALTIYLYQLMVEVVPAPDEAHQAIASEYTTSFYMALVEVTNLSGMLSQISCFKVHPLCPIALHMCVEHLSAFNDGEHSAFGEELKVMHNTLNSLKRINNLGQRSDSWVSVDEFMESE